jgi:hypothetical protein
MKKIIAGLLKEIFKIFIAGIILAIYGGLGFGFFLILNSSYFWFVVAVPIYLLMGFIFFLLKVSKHRDIYGALEIVLGICIVLIPFLMIMDNAEAKTIKYISIYFAFYTGIYIQVRGYESIYKKWTSNFPKVNKKDQGLLSKLLCKVADKYSIDK